MILKIGIALIIISLLIANANDFHYDEDRLTDQIAGWALIGGVCCTLASVAMFLAQWLP